MSAGAVSLEASLLGPQQPCPCVPMEAFPTEEQIEKVQLCGCLFTVVGLVIESISAIVLYKNNKKN